MGASAARRPAPFRGSGVERHHVADRLPRRGDGMHHRRRRERVDHPAVLVAMTPRRVATRFGSTARSSADDAIAASASPANPLPR